MLLSSAGGLSPGIFYSREDTLKDLSVFVDESGTQEGKAKFYVVTLVLHDQADDISAPVASYKRSLSNRGLSDIPFHATPLMRAHDEYANLDLATRKKYLTSFGILVQRLPIKYRSFIYRSSEFETSEKLQSLIKRDLVSLLVDNLELFQSYDYVKIYYDKGQAAVTHALQTAFEFALSKQAYIARNSEYRAYRLSQVADYLCAIELTAAKYETSCATSTDDKFFGSIGSFKKNWLKQARRKRIDN